MNKLKEVFQFIERLYRLPYRDKRQLDAFLSDCTEIIRTANHHSDKYAVQLKKISFAPNSFYSSPQDYRDAWNSGIIELSNLLEKFFQEGGHGLISDKEKKLCSFIEKSKKKFQPSPSSTSQQNSKKKNQQVELPTVKPMAIKTEDNFNMVQVNKLFSPEETKKTAEAAQTAPQEKIDDYVVDTFNRVFVVHGIDEQMKNTVVDVISRWGIQPILLRNHENIKKTMKQKALEYFDVSFAIVLLSQDHFSYPKEGRPMEAVLTPDQRVTFEMGYWIGKLGRERVFVLYNEQNLFRRPTEYFDAFYCCFDEQGSWKKELLNRLTLCEYKTCVEQETEAPDE